LSEISIDKKDGLENKAAITKFLSLKNQTAPEDKSIRYHSNYPDNTNRY
jgi:hypothetical protein